MGSSLINSGSDCISWQSKSLKCYNINEPSKPIKHLYGSGPPSGLYAAAVIWNILPWCEFSDLLIIQLNDQTFADYSIWSVGTFFYFHHYNQNIFCFFDLQTSLFTVWNCGGCIFESMKLNCCWNKWSINPRVGLKKMNLQWTNIFFTKSAKYSSFSFTNVSICFFLCHVW